MAAKKKSNVEKARTVIMTHGDSKTPRQMIQMVKRRCDTTDQGARSVYYTARVQLKQEELI